MNAEVADRLLGLGVSRGGLYGDATGIDAWRYALLADRINELSISFAKLHDVTSEAAMLCDVPLASAGRALRAFHLSDAETLASWAELSIIAEHRLAAEATQ